MKEVAAGMDFHRMDFSVRHSFCTTLQRNACIRFDRPEGQPMRRFLRKLWRDDRGYVPVMEWMLVASILTLGVIAAQLAVHMP
jgi:hypothetical protein